MDEILTPGEQKLIIMSILCNPEGLTNMKIDYNKLAEKSGFKNGESARVTFGKARRKLLDYAGEDGSAPKTPSPTKPSPNKVTKRGGKAGGTPTKGKREPKKSAKKVKDEPEVEPKVEPDESNGVDDAEGTPSQVEAENDGD